MKFEEDTFNEGAIVEIDGNEFVRCKFRQCTLVYRATALPTIIGCVFGDEVTFDFQGAARATLVFISALHASGLPSVVDGLAAELKRGNFLQMAANH